MTHPTRLRHLADKLTDAGWEDDAEFLRTLAQRIEDEDQVQTDRVEGRMVPGRHAPKRKVHGRRILVAHMSNVRKRLHAPRARGRVDP